MSKTPRNTELAEVNRLIRQVEAQEQAEQIRHGEAVLAMTTKLWQLRIRRQKVLDAAEADMEANPDPAPLDRALDAVLAAPSAPPKLDMQKFAASVFGMHAERFDGMA
jgi:hypothetical protein